MTEIQMLTWAIAGGFAGTWVIMGAIFTLMLSFRKELKMEIAKLDEKILDIDRRLCRIEGSMMNKDCCMLKQDHSAKAE